MEIHNTLIVEKLFFKLFNMFCTIIKNEAEAKIIQDQLN